MPTFCGHTHLQATRAIAQTKARKRVCLPNRTDTATLDRRATTVKEGRTHNIGLAIWRLKCFYETFVQSSTLEILLNFCAKNPPHRQAENRYAKPKSHSQYILRVTFWLPQQKQK